MPNTTEKRHSTHGIDTRPASPGHDPHGVGARHTGSPTPDGGGGYLDNCTTLKFGAGAPTPAADPRMAELRAIGLPKMWIDVAEIVGFDAFLRLWRYLDENPTLVVADGGLGLKLRRYASYLRYQRNSYIERLYMRGKSFREIQVIVKKTFRQSVSKRHLYRIVKGA